MALSQNPQKKLVESARKLGQSRHASIIRSWSIPIIYAGMEEIMASDNDPIPQTIELFDHVSLYFESQNIINWDKLIPDNLTEESNLEVI